MELVAFRDVARQHMLSEACYRAKLLTPWARSKIEETGRDQSPTTPYKT
jgi:hypothetical protein